MPQKKTWSWIRNPQSDMSPQQRQSIFYLFLRDEEPLPRGMMRLHPTIDRRGTDSMKSCTTVKDMTKFCHFNKDVFINLFSDQQKGDHVFDMIFLDIDNKDDLQTSLSSLLQILMRLHRDGIKEYNVYFSGSKGFHIYVRFEPTQLNNYRIAIMGLLKELDIFQYVDLASVEQNRLTRVPYSINTKTGLCCIPIVDAIFDIEIDRILERATTEQAEYNADKLFKINEGLGAKIKKHDSNVLEHTSNGTTMMIGQGSGMFDSYEMYPKCMQELVTSASDGVQLGHHERLEMGKFLLYALGDVDKVAQYYEKQDNYVESKTKYHLNYIMKNNLKLSKCDKLLDVCVCPYKNKAEQESECPFQPSLNKFITSEVNG